VELAGIQLRRAGHFAQWASLLPCDGSDVESFSMRRQIDVQVKLAHHEARALREPIFAEEPA